MHQSQRPIDQKNGDRRINRHAHSQTQREGKVREGKGREGKGREGGGRRSIALTPGVGPRVLEDEGDHGVGVGEGVGHVGQVVAELLQHPGEHRVGAQREVVERVEAARRSQLRQPAQPLRRDAPQRRDADDAELPRAHVIQGQDILLVGSDHGAQELYVVARGCGVLEHVVAAGADEKDGPAKETGGLLLTQELDHALNNP